MNKLWVAFLSVSFIAALYQWIGLGNIGIFDAMMQSIFSMSQLSIEIAIGLIGLLCFWMGILKLAEASGVLAMIAKMFQPLFHRLMPEIPRDHPALGHISMNMAANVFGLDNAATPAGIKAMESMQGLNPQKDTATNAQILFLVLNTSSVTLFPVTVLMYRAQQGAANPAEVFVPILLATSASTLVGLIAVAWVQRINLFDRVIAAYLGAATLALSGLIWGFSGLPPEQMSTYSEAIGNGLILTAILSFVLLAYRKKVAVYDTFIEGAKEGFSLAVTIMPYLVAMLVAIGLLRTSGLFDLTLDGIRWIVSLLGGNTQFVDALPTAFMKPFSGSGSRAMMLETINNFGVDSFPAKLAATFQASTETTFYVLAVYFGAVNIKKVRHAIGCGLMADLAGIVAAVFLAYWFFSG